MTKNTIPFGGRCFNCKSNEHPEHHRCPCCGISYLYRAKRSKTKPARMDRAKELAIIEAIFKPVT